MPKILLVSLLLAFSIGHSIGQTLQNKFRVIGKAEGLPSLLNINVYETSDGYFWLATQTGLIRYDGKKFEPFYAYFTDSNSITGNTVTDLQEDKQHVLWIGSFSAGMSSYHLQTGKWTQYKHPTPDNRPLYPILDFFYDKEERLWIGTGGRGLLQMDQHSGKFIQHIPDPGLPADGADGNANTIREIADDPSDPDILWLAAMDGLYRFRKSTKEFTRYENRKKGEKKWKDNCFHTLLTTQGDIIWLGTWAGGLVSFNKRTGQFFNFPMYEKEYARNNLGTNIVADIFRTSDSTLYIAANEEGLFEFNTTTKKYTPVITEETGIAGGPPGVLRISETSNNCIWISGMNNIYLQHPIYNRFGSLHKFNKARSGKNIYPCDLRDMVWLTSNNKYWMAVTSTEGVQEYDKEFNFIRSIPVGNSTTGLAARSIETDRAGKIWIAVAQNSYFYYYDSLSGIFQPSSIPCGKTGHFLIDRNNCIWSVIDSFLVKYDIDAKISSRFLIHPEKASGLKLPVSHAVLREDAHGNIWIATNIGLWKFNDGLKEWRHFYPDPQRKGNSLADAFVRAIAITPEQQVWIAPQSQGLQVVDIASNKFIASHHVHSNTSFRSPQVNFIETDHAGNVWVASNNGLGVLRKGNDQWDWFGERDGIPKDYLDQPLFASGNNKIILAQYEGFIGFDASNREGNKSSPRMKLTGLLIDGENSLEKRKENSFTVNYDQKRIAFLFTAIEPVQPDRLLYLYKLEGYDKEWQSTVLGSIQYTGLQAGNYVFIVKAGVNDGSWSEELRVPVIVLLPFWKKGWFIVAVILILASLVYVAYRYRIRQFMRLQEMRNDISRNLHDELGCTVSSMNMLATVAKKQISETEPAFGLLTQIGQSAQQAGESIDEIIWSISPGQESAMATMNRIRGYVSGLFDPAGIIYTIEFKYIPENLKLGNALRRDIWLVCKEAVNNIIKFSQCKKASLLICFKDNFIEITISDDGKGFNLQQALLSGRNGLKNMQSRVAQYKKGRFRIDTDAGTRIFFRFPASNGPKM